MSTSRTDRPGPWPTRISGLTALGGLTAVVLVAVLAVVAVPRLLSPNEDDDVFSSTTIIWPDRVANLPRLADAAVTAEDRRPAEQLLQAVRVPLATRTAVYGQATGVRLTAVTGRPGEPLSSDDLTSLRRGFASGMQQAGAPVQELDPGALGGWFGCGQAAHGLTLCLSLDAGAVVSIAVTSKNPSAIALAQTARQSVLHRPA